MCEALEVVNIEQDLLSDGRHDEPRQLARAIEGKAVDLVHDRGVEESLNKLIAVGVKAGTLDHG